MTPVPAPTLTSTLRVIPLTQGATIVFVGETIPDGTNIQPGQTFQKTWTLKNGGTRTWDKGFVLVRTSSSPNNEILGSPEQIPLSKEVKPGETIQIGVDLVAPKQNGQYTVFYQLQDETGSQVPNSQIWVTITVGNITLSGSGGIVTGGATSMNGVTATLTSFTTGAQSSTVSFCMTLPNRNYGPAPASVSILIDQQSILASTGGSLDTGCFEFEFPVIETQIAQAKSVAISIKQVRILGVVNGPQGSCSSARLKLKGQYPGLDFECHFSMAGYYTNLQLPAGMTREQANTLIVDTIEGAIYGPWILNVSAP